MVLFYRLKHSAERGGFTTDYRQMPLSDQLKLDRCVLLTTTVGEYVSLQRFTLLWQD